MPGFSRASFTSSSMLLAGKAGCTASATAVEPMSATGVKSLTTSNGAFATAGLVTTVLFATSSV